jgi:hypothetical protein
MLFIYDNSLLIWHCFSVIFTMFPICFFYNKACNWNIGFLQIVNISKLYHILGSNHSTFYVWSFQVLFSYKFLVLKMQTKFKMLLILRPLEEIIMEVSFSTNATIHNWVFHLWMESLEFLKYLRPSFSRQCRRWG